MTKRAFWSATGIALVLVVLGLDGNGVPGAAVAEPGPQLLLPLGHAERVSSVALSTDGKRILTGSFDHTAILWDADTANPIQTFKGHNGSITSATFGPKDAFVLTGSLDGTVRLWKPGREEPICSFLAAGDDWLFWTPEGYYTCSPNGENLIAWKISDGSPQGYRIVGPEQFRKKFYRPDLFRHLLRELDLTRALARADEDSIRTPASPSSIQQEPPPVVMIARPLTSREVIKTEHCEIAAKARGIGDNHVLLLQLVLDGRPSQTALARFTPRAGEVTAKWTVDLPVGKSRIQVLAESVKGSTDRSPEVEIIREGEAPPQLLLLGIGVSDYEHIDRKGTEHAAESVKRFLEAQVKASKALYPNPILIPLVDDKKQPLPEGQATRASILDALDELSSKAREALKSGKKPVSVIFLAGHGELKEGAVYFMTTDSERRRLRATALSGTELKGALAAIPGKVIVFLDACHAGAFAEKLYGELSHGEGVVMLCSSLAGEASLERPAFKAGLFTQAVLEGLSGKAPRDKDGVIFTQELFEYVHKRVRELSEEGQHPFFSRLKAVDDVPLAKP